MHSESVHIVKNLFLYRVAKNSHFILSAMFLCVLPLTNDLCCVVAMRFSESTTEFSSSTRDSHACIRSFLFFFPLNHIELLRFLDQARATASSGYSRNYSNAEARKRKKPIRVSVLCVFSSFCALSPAGFTASLIPVPFSRGNTKQGTCS